jgi:hypothetical protein
MTKKAGRKPAAPRQDWTPERDQAVRDRYPHEPSATLAASLGVTLDALYTQARRLGVKKTQAYLDSPSSGRLNGQQGTATRFQPGCTPWSKGLKGLRHSSANWFQPGHRPANYMQVGSTRMQAGYRWVKVQDGCWPDAWKPEHHLVWEQANGPVPAGHVLCFRDKNRLNITLDNLELLTRQEWLSRITLHNYPLELVRLMQTRGLLTRAINRRAKSGPEAGTTS